MVKKSKKELKNCEDLILEYEDKLQKLKEKASIEKKKIDAARDANRSIHLEFSEWQPSVKHFIGESLLEESLHPDL
ncbi:hypothetical protein COLO4_21700 [Corchorus olitorius]|uniref:Uncharacterized protein n=1 Tax=Corchorus olitorius TaxID=93759 RepID=A0A1R3IRN7_9ROSI|nr:hypothetical protein COLO4_21700 [Corchorus olitorius]